MRIAFGAWGIGAVAAAMSPVWHGRFGRKDSAPFTIPPMSSLHPGQIELFPFLLAERIFIDAAQFDLLTSATGRAVLASAGYYIADGLGPLLQEFVHADVLSPVDYSSIAKPHLGAVAIAAEQTLDSAHLGAAAASSRDLWRQFLTSTGGQVIAHRHLELMQLIGRTDPAAYAGDVEVNPSLFGGRRLISKAALGCGHDVFDVMVMQRISSSLGASVCDWQMYQPIYRDCATSALPASKTPSAHIGPIGHDVRRENDPMTPWYMPTPQTTRVRDVWKMREGSYISTLRAEVAQLAATRLIHRGDADTLLRLRQELHRQVPGAILNTYAHYEAAQSATAFLENLPTFESPVASSTRTSASITPKEPAAKSLFISYAAADNSSGDAAERWLDRLVNHVNPLVRQGRVRVFSTDHMLPGEDSHVRIRREIDAASVAVLLVSSSYLASDHVNFHELPSLLWRRHNQGMIVIPLIISHCLFDEAFFLYPDPKSGPLSMSLSAFQPVNPPSQPLRSMAPSDQDRVLVDLARQIHRILVDGAT